MLGPAANSPPRPPAGRLLGALRERLGRRWRRERNPIFRVLLLALALVLVLNLCSGATIAAVKGLDFARAQLGPGGAFSALGIGQPAPELGLSTAEGRRVSLSDYRGRPVAVNFWAAWCMPCRLEVPVLNAIDDPGPAGPVVLGVGVGESAESARRFAARNGVTYALLPDESSLASDRFGIVDLPTTVWLDAEGRIHAVDIGRLDEGEAAARLRRLAPAAPP